MKFSIRDLMLLTVIVALATGWWIARTQIEQLRKDSTSLTKQAAELERDNKRLQRIIDRPLLEPFKSNGDARSFRWLLDENTNGGLIDEPQLKTDKLPLKPKLRPRNR
jgi:hypothetical protein